jgi:predicted acetyltransferase
MTARLALVWPAPEHLSSYTAALRRDWSPDSILGLQATREQLATIAKDPQAFLSSLVNRSPSGALVTLPDGSTVRRLPGYRRWLWDGEFCGSIGFRWQPGWSELPPYVLGHIGYAVVPWKRNRGYATKALRLMLGEAKAEGLTYVDITTDPGNWASRRVIEANAGTLVEEFTRPASFGGTPAVRYRISL